MIGLHLESLDENRINVWKKLAKFADMGVLAGGTAIALQIGHRKSYDFDIFPYKPLEASLFRKCKTVFGSGVVKTYESREQLNISTPENIKVTFYYPDYQPKFDTLKTGVIDLLDLRDLASNKALTIGQRGKWRDYVDIYFLLKDKLFTLAQIIEIAEARFSGEFSKRLFLEQLVYFDDVTSFETDFLRDEVDPNEIKRFLVREVEKNLEM